MEEVAEQRVVSDDEEVKVSETRPFLSDKIKQYFCITHPLVRIFLINRAYYLVGKSGFIMKLKNWPAERGFSKIPIYPDNLEINLKDAIPNEDDRGNYDTRPLESARLPYYQLSWKKWKILNI